MDRRFRRVETLADLALAMALQQPGASPVEVLNALPDPTNLDLGRQIVVRLPGETVSTIYMGLLGADDVVFWQRLAQGTGGGSSSSPEYTFVGHIDSAGGRQWSGAQITSTYVYSVALNSTALWRYVRSTGSFAAAILGVGASSGIVRDGSSNSYLAQPSANQVQKVTSGGSSSYTGTSHAYNAVAHRLGTSNLFATATDTNAFYKLDMGTLAISNTVTGLNNPQGIAVDSADNIYVANAGTNTIRKYDSGLTFVDDFGSAGSGDGQFSTPKGLAFDASDRLYVCDSGNDRVQVFDTSGTFLGKFGSSGSGSGQLDNPSGIHVFSTTIVVADQGNTRGSEWLRAS